MSRSFYVCSSPLISAVLFSPLISVFVVGTNTSWVVVIAVDGEYGKGDVVVGILKVYSPKASGFVCR